MSSDPVVPINAENERESPYVAPDTHGRVEDTEGILAGRGDRLLEREYPDSRPLGEIPGEPSPRLRETAETVGTAVGNAVNKARDLPRRLSDMKRRLTVIRGRAREDAATTAEEVRETARQRFQQAQTRVRHYAHEFPVQFILAMGGVAFVLGVFLRVWRSNHRG
jgi:ElaB/YqjD/DUF883 family membrane-anchored ribosome-binding protein